MQQCCSLRINKILVTFWGTAYITTFLRKMEAYKGTNFSMFASARPLLNFWTNRQIFTKILYPRLCYLSFSRLVRFCFPQKVTSYWEMHKLCQVGAMHISITLGGWAIDKHASFFLWASVRYQNWGRMKYILNYQLYGESCCTVKARNVKLLTEIIVNIQLQIHGLWKSWRYSYVR